MNNWLKRKDKRKKNEINLNKYFVRWSLVNFEVDS